jgi:beta-barrel assembly-enhancing protease
MTRALTALIAGLLLAAPAAADWKLPKLPAGFDQVVGAAKEVKAAVGTPEEDEERALGQTVAATLLGASKPLADPDIQRYVNRVGLWVALQGKRPGLPWRFAVLDNGNVNAFAAPGGYVFITRGLLDQLQTEAELAAVLAHEIAHIEKKHHLKALQKEAGLKLAGRGATLLLNRDGTAGKLDPERLGQVAGIAKGLYARGLDKSDEYEADRVGAILAARAGYDVFGLAQVLQTLDRLNASASEVALLFKTHPRPAERLAQLDLALGPQLDAAGEQPSVAERFVATLRR